MPHNDSQNVVKVMGDTACKYAEAFQFLGLMEFMFKLFVLFLSPFTVGDIAHIGYSDRAPHIENAFSANSYMVASAIFANAFNFI